MKDQSEHWEKVYKTKSADAVSWFQEHASRSLDIIRSIGADKLAGIVDVGGGASTLVDDLLADGFRGITVLDLSQSALEVARSRFGAKSAAIDSADLRGSKPSGVAVPGRFSFHF